MDFRYRELFRVPQMGDIAGATFLYGPSVTLAARAGVVRKVNVAAVDRQAAAAALTRDSATLVSLLSAAFSSASVSARIDALSSRPSCFAHAISVP